MVNFCAVIGCSSRSGKGNEGVSFFRIPQVRSRLGNDYQELQKIRRMKWILALRRKDITEKKLEHFRICSKHFLKGKPADLLNRADPDWVPSLMMGYIVKTESSGQEDMNRFVRARMREINTLIQNQIRTAVPKIKSTSIATSTRETPVQYILKIEQPPAKPENPPPLPEMNANDKKVQTDIATDCVKELESVRKELISRNDMVYQLRDKVDQLMFSEKYLTNRRDVLLYYSGLPTMELFSMILSAISDCMDKSSALTPYQQLFATLMKLKLDMTFSILSFQFLVSRNVISRIFYKVINLLSSSLKNNIFWPEKESFQELLPNSFKKNFSNKIVITVDIFEIPIQKPSNLETKAETWSSEKQKNTVKFLIGITPQNVICFLSEGYGGSTSDCNVILESGILDNLNVGDSILMNRDFTSSDEGFHYATLIINSNGEKILEVADSEDSKKLDPSVITYVEKVVGNFKSKFNIMNGPLPIEMLQVKNENCVINEIITVCCALINLSSPTVQLV